MLAVNFSLALLLLAGQEARASEAEQPAQEQAADTGALQEVLVTAQRKSENIQKVDLAITELTPEVLQSNSVNSIRDLSYLVPSMSILGGRSRDDLTITIRGQGTNGAGIPGVITYLNEMPIPTDNLGQSATGPGLYYDMDNIQVLEGPQGTLFGRNAVGGAVLYQTKRPTNDFGGYLQAGYGNYNDREVQGALNLPVISDTLLVRLAVNAQDRDGFTKLLIFPALTRAPDLDDVDYVAERATVTLKLGEGFQNDLIYDGLNSHNHGTSTSIITNMDVNAYPANAFPGSAQLFALQQAAGPRTQIDPVTLHFSDRTWSSVEDILRYDITNGIVFRNILGYSRTYTNFNVNIGPYLNYGPVPQHIRQLSEEAQFQGKSFNDRLEWVVGGFYMNAPFQPFDYSPRTVLGGSSILGSQTATRSKAVYFQTTYDLSAWVNGLKLTTGFRYTWDSNSGTQQILTGDGACTTDPCTQYNGTTSSAPTWNLNLGYQATEDTLVYIASRRGYRTGGFTAGQDPQHDTYGPEYVLDEELGLKSQWRLGQMPVRTNIAIYHQAYTDVQVTQTGSLANGAGSSGSGTISFTGNAAAATVLGTEFQGTIVPTKNLELGAIFSWIHYKYTDFGPGVDAASLTAVPNNGLAPYQFGVNGRYTVPLGARMGEVSLAANYSWVDATLNQFPATPGGDVPSYGLLNLSLDWTHIAGENLNATFFMTNATNTLHNFGYGPVPGGSLYPYGLNYSIASYNEPRMYGIRLRYSFGAGED